jgi:hypothetical protein
MKSKHLDELITKYWDGETSIDEERQIRKHLHEMTDPEYDEIRTLFEFFSNEREVIYEKPLVIKKVKVIKVNFIKIIAVAASIILLIGAGYLFFEQYNTVQTKTTATTEINDPEEALRITKEALALLSENFEKGEETLTGTIENIEKLDIIKTN